MNKRKVVLQLVSSAILFLPLQACELTVLEPVVPSSSKQSVVAAPEPASGTATIEWDPPVSNDDGSPFTDLSTYRLRYGTTPGVASTTIEVGKVPQYTVFNLERGRTYYFTVTAVNSTGDESPPSNEVSRRID